MQNKYAIWDIDNCLADDKWRAHLIDWDKTGNERYDRYNAEMMGDPVEHVSEFQFMCRFTMPVFFTGRVEKWKSHTRQYLHQMLGVHHPLLFMRGNDDSSSPAALKHDMLIEFLRTPGVKRENIVAAFDDIPAIVQMYREVHGIPACVLRINEDFSGIYEPRDLAPISKTA